MSKWREDRMYEIMQHLNENALLRDLYEKALERAVYEMPNKEFFTRMEFCYEKILKEYENL